MSAPDPKRTCPGSKSCSAAVCCRAVCDIVGLAIAMNCTKNERLSVSIPLIQQAKIQAQVLVPLVKALQAELGKERANALVRRALGDVYRRYGEEFWRTKNEKNLGRSMTSAFATFAREDALDYRVARAVTRCLRDRCYGMPVR